MCECGMGLAQRWNIDLLAGLDAVRIIDSVRLGDLTVLVGVAVEVFADLRESVAGFDGVRLVITA